MPADGFQFVNISRPSDALKHRKQVRSHAARSLKRHEDTGWAKRRDDATGAESTSSHRTSPPPSPDDTPWSPPRLPLTILSPAKPDPFASWIRPLSPFEGFLLKYFIHNVVINDLSPQPFPPPGALTRLQGSPPVSPPRVSWTQAAAMDAGMLATLLLAAARDLARRRHPEVYAPVALAYKAECLRLLALAIAAEGPATSEATITKTLALASEELFAGTKATADRHLQAAAYMIQERGRPMRLAMWRHDDNVHMWTHWADIMAGVDTDTICQYTVAQHFAQTLENHALS